MNEKVAVRMCPASDSDHLGPLILCGSYRDSRGQDEASKINFSGVNLVSFILDKAKKFPNSSHTFQDCSSSSHST